MNPNGRKHILEVLRGNVACGLAIEPFNPSVADAYCYYVALGYTNAMVALRVMTSDDAVFESFKST